MTPEARERWRCFLCDRSSSQIGVHPLPVQQRAHLLPNRLTGGQRRYGGAKNAFTEAEWDILLGAIGSELQVEFSDSDQLRKQAITHCYDLCGECHEEVLSEPIYLPCVMNSLKKRFKGRARVDKILLLAQVLKLGAEALERDNDLPPVKLT
jgi:hypothetical protein